MFQYIISRLLYGFVVLLGAIVVVFFIFNILPGDPVALMSAQRTDVAGRESIRRDFGLDKPKMVQLGNYLNDLSPVSLHYDTQANKDKYKYTVLFHTGDKVVVLKTPYLRRSFQTGKYVMEIIMENLEGTFWLTFAAMMFATVFGIIFGVFASLKQNSLLDHTMVSLSVLGISAPPFVVAALFAMVFGYYLSDYTGLNSTGQLWEIDLEGKKLMLKNLILPAITLGLRPLAIIVQLTRSSMLEVLSQDYIRTARAKGLKEHVIIVKHALKNALNPVITAVSGWLASLMAGAFFIEVVFDWKGLGKATIDAVNQKDFPVVMGTTIFVALIFIIINIMVDVLYAVIDPRVKLK